MANVSSTEKRVRIVRALVEGNSIRATARMTPCSKNTVTKLLVELGEACSRYQDEALRDLPCRRLQLDEIWSFVAMKEKTAKRKGLDRPAKVGDTWTWTAICADTKLVPSWMVGQRDARTANAFVEDVAGRLRGLPQVTTDGLNVYLEAVESAFGMNVDYAMLIKLYGPAGDGEGQERRYSPATVKGIVIEKIQGEPDPAHIATSYVERQNLTMRMSMRRFTRLTNGFSKKEENHADAVSLHYFHYNFIRPHQTLTENAGGTPTTPAMAVGVATRPYTWEWAIEHLLSN
jgi:IS1 family transposase